MTEYELIMALLGVISLLVTAGDLVISLLNFLDKRNNKQ